MHTKTVMNSGRVYTCPSLESMRFPIEGGFAASDLTTGGSVNPYLKDEWDEE